jgi:pimeloyl-ACP methyl ester carboxylesterase
MKKRIFSLFSTGSVLGFAFLFNTFSGFRSVMGKRLPLKNGHYYRWKYGNVYYSKCGKGTPLLLIHELLPVSSGEEWSESVRILAETHTVYTLDLPGCGRSDKPDLLYTQFFYDQMIVDFISDVIQAPCNAMATGSSFPILVMARRLDPKCFLHIIGVNPTPVEWTYRYPTAVHRLLRYILASPFAGTFIYNVSHCKFLITNDMVRNAFYDPSKLKKETVDLYYRFAHYDHHLNKMLFSSMLTRFMNLDIRNAVRQAENLSIITGAADEQGVHAAKACARMNRSIRVRKIQKTKHLPQMENPELFCLAAEELLQNK